jgi:hypothetical protein
VAFNCHKRCKCSRWVFRHDCSEQPYNAQREYTCIETDLLFMFLFSEKLCTTRWILSTLMFVHISTSKSITIHVNTCNLFQATNILSCNLFTMHILTLYLHIYNKISITTLSFDNHPSKDGHGRPKHVGWVSCIYNLLSFYCSAVFGINMVILVDFCACMEIHLKISIRCSYIIILSH